MTSSGESDELVTPLRNRRRGTRPGFLCVVPFLLEEKPITRINKDTCSKREIERLKTEGFGPPPNNHLNSDGKVEFSLALSVDQFKEKLVEIYPKLANRPFFLLKANKSNDLEHIDIEPSNYTPKDIYHSNLGQGKLYIRIGIIEEFEETIPRPKKKPKRDQAINPGSFPIYRHIQPKPSTILSPVSLANGLHMSTNSPLTRATGIFSATPIATSVSRLSVSTSSAIVTPHTITAPLSSMLTETASSVDVSGEAANSTVPPKAGSSNISSSDLLRGQPELEQQQQRQQQQKDQLQQQQIELIAQELQKTQQLFLTPQAQRPSNQQEQQHQQQQLQQQKQQSISPHLLGDYLERYLGTPTLNVIAPASLLPTSNYFFSSGGTSALTLPSAAQTAIPRTSSVPLPIPLTSGMTNSSNSLSYPMPVNNVQYRENPSPLNILAETAETMLQNGPMQPIPNTNINLELEAMECNENEVSQITKSSATNIPEPFDIEGFVQCCRETGHLTVSEVVAQNKEVVRRVREECPTIHSLTIEPPCQPKDVYELFQPPSTLQSLVIKGNVFDDDNSQSLLVDFVFKLNNLVKLDLSSSTFLSDMHFTFVSSLGRLKNLKSLYLNSNKLRIVGAEALSVALSSLSNLEVLNLSNNSLTDEGVGKISDKIGKLSNLEVLELSSNFITSSGVSYLLKRIHVLVRLEKLDLSCNFIDDDFLEKVDGEHLKFLNLQQILLNSNKMTWLGVSHLCSMLPCKSLRTFDLSSNCAGFSLFALAGTGRCFRLLSSLNLANTGILGATVYGLEALLKNVKNLEILDLSNNKLTSNDFEILKEPISNMSGLKVFNISNNATNNSVWQILERIFTKMVSLEVLNCENVALVGGFFSSSCPKFGLLPSLKKLGLARNGIDSVSGRALSAQLEALTLLEEIDLKQNYIGGEGFEQLCNSLKCLSLLRNINIASNYLCNAGAKSLGDVLSSFPCLEELDLSKNYITGDGMGKIWSAMASLKHLKKLNLSYNDICYGQNNTSFVINQLLLLHRLEELRLGYCNIGEDIIKTLSFGLKSLMYLRIFDVSGNAIGCEGTKALADVLPSLHLLQELFLYWPHAYGDEIEYLFSNLTSLKYVKNLKISGSEGRFFKAFTSMLQSLHLMEEVSFSEYFISKHNVETIFSGLRHLKFLKTLLLRSIDCSFIKQLGNVLPSLGFLEKLDLSCCKLDGEDIEILCPGLKSLTFLKVIDFDRNKVGVRGVKVLGGVFRSLHFLEELNLKDCDIDHDVAETLFSSLASLTSLKTLSIGVNKIGQKGTKALVDVLPSFYYLEKLNLDCCGIGEDDIELLCSGLRRLMYLKIFYFGYNNIGQRGIKALANVFPSLHFLEQLFLYVIHIDEDHSEILFHSLASLHCLKIVDVSENHFGYSGIAALADTLSSLYFLEELSLGSCGIGERDFEIFFTRLRPLRYLKKLDIRSNSLAHGGTKALADVLPSLHLLEELRLSDCDIGENDIEILCSGLTSLKYLKKFDISENNLKSAVALGNVFPWLRFLEKLNLSLCCLGAVDIEILCGSLSSLTCLKKFNISLNDIGSRGAKALASILPLFCNLQKLTLDGCGFDEDGIEMLCSALSSLTNLRKVNSNEVNYLFTDKEELADAIRDNGN